MRLFSFLLVILGAIAVSCTGTDRIASGSIPTSSIPEYGLLLVSTLDGSLTAINSDTGHQRWSFNLGAPLLESPRDPLTGFTFIPDPKDGQIFALQDGALEKLPYTVPQLVKASPSRSGKGVLFAGSKKDVWISINPETGHKLDALPPPPASSYCPVGHPENIFIGRIDYTLSMLDSNKKDVQWNASFTDYSSHLLPPDNEYPFAHYSLPNDGVILTYDGRHDRLFKTRVSGVIANLYLLKTDGLHLLPHTAISTTLFDAIVREPDLISDLQLFVATHRGPSSTVDSAEYVPNPNSRLENMLYVGETQHGLYAIPAVVDREAVPPKSLGPLLMTGPVKQVALDVDGNRPIVVRPQFSAKVHPNMVTYRTEQGEYLLLGYHRAPQLTSSDQMQFTDPSPFSINYRYITDYNQNSMPSQPRCYGRNCPTAANRRSRRVSPEISKGNPLGIGYDQDEEYMTRAELLLEMWNTYPLSSMGAAALIVSLVVATVYLFGRESGKNDRLLNEVSRNSQSRSRANTGSANDASRRNGWSLFGRNSRSNQAAPVEPEAVEDPNLPPGWFSIGKIQYDRNCELGSGGQGTVVYKGRFDGRDAAVKRVLASVLTYVDREITLLRESDSHPNVIRYFCSEADDHFRFIALELCECSLRDYVVDDNRRASFKDVDSLDIIKQATDGLAHLHQMNIVHRDVKPQNILLTRNHRGQARVLISDFGLCKKIQHGHASLSRMSGFVGTEGYIAPEMYDTDGTRVTHLVDVFSLGCVYYFVLTNGKHPFGDSIQRQSNILKGEYSLVALAGRETTFDIAAMNLIESMIQLKPIQRPRLSAVLAHPMFWNKERQLQFYMDVSDRIEKEDEASDVLVRLEHWASRVSRNWHHVICSYLEADLNKFRTYKGHSIRDLLRALRNKKHHYRELPPDVKESLGDIPNGYVHYWNSRFPRLLMHSYNAMIVCAEEPAFATYYPTEAHSFCNRRLESELDKDFVVAGTGSQLRHTTSTPALQGSPQKPRRSPAEAVNNWRDNSPSPGPSAPAQSTPPAHNITPRGPQSANAAKKLKKAKKARALFNALPQVYEGTMGPDGDANDENASAPPEED